MSQTTMPDHQILLDQLGWLRGLARQLVDDRDAAEDLAQDTVVTALRQPPAAPLNMRAWLARVLRNRVNERARRDQRQRDRERRQAELWTDARKDASPEDLLERVRLQKHLAQALMDLPEPFRRTVLMRFYDELPPREIARREGVPVATVKSRLHRGVAQLREKLDADYQGHRGAWLAIALPLARQTAVPAAAAAATLGGLLVQAKVAVPIALVLASTGIWWATRSPDQPHRGEALAHGQPEPDAWAKRADGSPGTDPAALREGDRSPLAGSPAVGSPPAEPLRAVRGIVLDGDGLPLEGLGIRARDGEEVVKSQPDGSFRLQTTAKRLDLVAADAAWVTVRQGFWSANATLQPVLVVARSLDLRGRVVDEAGQAIPQGAVTLELPADFTQRFSATLSASTAPEWRGPIAAGGSFDLARVPAIRGATLRASSDGFRPARIDAPMRSMAGLEIRMIASDSAASPGRFLRGRVLLPDGQPAQEARLALGGASARANENGWFSIDRSRALDADELIAVQAGYRPVTITRTGDQWDDFITLQLTGKALTIRGRIVHADGSAAGGARVWLHNPSLFGVIGTTPIHSEGLMAGARLPPRAVESLHKLPEKDGEESFGSARPVGSSNAMLPWVRADANGAFTLPGLDARRYTLRIADENLRWGTLSPPIQAGTLDAEIRVPKPDVFEELRGRIVTRHGDPVPGVRVQQWISALSVETRVFGGTSNVTRFLLGPTVVADAEGRFVIRDIPRAHIQFHIASDKILPSYSSVEAVTDPDAFEVEVAVRARLRVEIADPDRVDAIAVKNFRGGEEQILLMRADGYSNFSTYPLSQGRSGVVTVTSNAAKLHLLKGKKVVEVIDLELRPAETTVIRR